MRAPQPLAPMSRALRTARLVGPACYFPAHTVLLARAHVEGPFGNAPGIPLVTGSGLLAALVCAGVGAWRLRARRDLPGAWFVAALLAATPALYFVLWNVFFRADG